MKYTPAIRYGLHAKRDIQKLLDLGYEVIDFRPPKSGDLAIGLGSYCGDVARTTTMGICSNSSIEWWDVSLIVRKINA